MGITIVSSSYVLKSVNIGATHDALKIMQGIQKVCILMIVIIQFSGQRYGLGGPMNLASNCDAGQIN